MHSDPTPQLLRKAFRSVPTGVVLVAAERAGQPVGLLASSFTSVSLEPPLVQVSIMRSSSTWPLLRTAPRWGISLLGADDGGQLSALSAPAAQRFDAIETHRAEGGALLLPGSPLRLIVEPHTEVEAGDHVLLLLSVLGIEHDSSIHPLVLHDRTARRLAA